MLEDVEGFQQSRTPYIAVWAVGNIKPWINRDRMSGGDHYDSGDQQISIVRTAELQQSTVGTLATIVYIYY